MKLTLLSIKTQLSSLIISKRNLYKFSLAFWLFKIIGQPIQEGKYDDPMTTAQNLCKDIINSK